MKKALTICLLFASSLLFNIKLYAQDVTIGARGGLSIPNLSAGSGDPNPLIDGYHSRTTADVAVFADFKVSNLFSIQPMIEYSLQGGKRDGLQGFTTPAAFAAAYPPGQAPTYLYADFKGVVKLDYFMIPVLAKFGWDLKKKSPCRFYVDAGPFVGFLVGAHQLSSGSSQVYTDAAGQQPLPVGTQSFNNDENIKGSLHHTNFGVEGNAGFKYSMGRGSIFAEGGFNYGFITIQKEAVNGHSNTGAATASIGYSYRLGK